MQGSFGRLFKGDYLGVDVAIKNLFMTDDAEEDAKYLAREISALKYEIAFLPPSFFFVNPILILSAPQRSSPPECCSFHWGICS